MKTAYFPVGLLNEPDVIDLSADHKLLLGGSSIHPSRTACGVIRLTDFVFAQFGFLPGAVYNYETREFFIKKNFSWNKTAKAAGAGSPWATQIESSLAQVRCRVVTAAVQAAIDAADADPDTKRIETIGVPTNLLTAIPRSNGKRWTPSELLLLLAMYIDDNGMAPGLLVIDQDALGALCSLPAKTVLESADTLTAGGAIVFDVVTHETCVFARLKNATARELPNIAEAVDNLRSRSVKHASKKHFSRTFPTYSNKSTTSAPKEKKRKENKKKGEENKGTSADAADLVAASPPAATAFLSKIEELRKNGARTKDVDLSTDKKWLDRIVDFAAAVGEQRVLEVIEGCHYPLEALRACEAVPGFLAAVRQYRNPVAAAIAASEKSAQKDALDRLQAEANACPKLPKKGSWKPAGDLVPGLPA